MTEVIHNPLRPVTHIMAEHVLNGTQIARVTVGQRGAAARGEDDTSLKTWKGECGLRRAEGPTVEVQVLLRVVGPV